MESYLADVKQVFNVKDIAAVGLAPDAIPNNTVGFLDSSTNLTVAPTTVWAAMPDTFAIIAKIDGKVYYSFSDIDKNTVIRKNKVNYVAPRPNAWEGVIDCCACINNVTLNIHVDDSELVDQDGLTWTHRDFAVEVSTQEMKCLCSCDGTHKVFENNIMTMLLVNKVNAMNSPYYEAGAAIDISSLDTGTTAPPTGGSEAEGDLYVRTGTTSPGLYAYDGTAWNLVGDETGVLTDIETFVETMKAQNTASPVVNAGPLLKFTLTGKIKETPEYANLEPNYVYPRGARITPSIDVSGKCSVEFTETQTMRYEQGAGYDLRAEEWEVMNYYTNLNFLPQLSDGLQNSKLKYQFENGKTYDTISLEFTTPNVETNSGRRRLFGITFGVEQTTVGTPTAVFTNLAAMFGV